MAEVAPELTLIMPVFNELETVDRAINGVLDAGLPVELELLVVDDGSLDGTSDLLARHDWPSTVRILRHERNRGKGAAIRSALAEARGRYTSIVDADLEYEPADIALLLAPLRSGEARAVFGTRAFRSHSAFSFWYVVGNRAVTFTANFLYDSWISDLMTAYKAMETELFRSLDLRERGFAIEAEIAARLLGSGVRVFEVPIDYRARSREEGKKLTALDGLRVLRTLLRCRIA